MTNLGTYYNSMLIIDIELLVLFIKSDLFTHFRDPFAKIAVPWPCVNSAHQLK